MISSIARDRLRDLATEAPMLRSTEDWARNQTARLLIAKIIPGYRRRRPVIWSFWTKPGEELR